MSFYGVFVIFIYIIHLNYIFCTCMPLSINSSLKGSLRKFVFSSLLISSFILWIVVLFLLRKVVMLAVEL